MQSPPVRSRTRSRRTRLVAGLASAVATEGGGYSVSTDIVQDQFISASTGQGQILSGGSMNFNIGTVTNNSSIIAAGGNINGTFNYTPLNGTSAQETIWDSTSPSTLTTTYSPFPGGYSPVLSANGSITATIPTLNSVNIGTPTTGVGGNVTTVYSGGGPSTANGGAASLASTVASLLNTTGSPYTPTANSGSIASRGSVSGVNGTAVASAIALGATTGARYAGAVREWPVDQARKALPAALRSHRRRAQRMSRARRARRAWSVGRAAICREPRARRQRPRPVLPPPCNPHRRLPRVHRLRSARRI